MTTSTEAQDTKLRGADLSAWEIAALVDALAPLIETSKGWQATGLHELRAKLEGAARIRVLTAKE